MVACFGDNKVVTENATLRIPKNLPNGGPPPSKLQGKGGEYGAQFQTNPAISLKTKNTIFPENVAILI
jgi:hypothetical protein